MIGLYDSDDVEKGLIHHSDAVHDETKLILSQPAGVFPFRRIPLHRQHHSIGRRTQQEQYTSIREEND